LTAWCLGLVILDKETCSIRLVHKSLFEYLKKQHEAGQLFEHGQSEIAQTCLICMNFDNDSTKQDRTPISMGQCPDEFYKQGKEFCLIAYAIQNWGWHSKKDETEVVTDLAVNLFFRPFDSLCISHGLYHSLYDLIEHNPRNTYLEIQQSPDTSPEIHAAALFNDTNLITALLEENKGDVNLQWPWKNLTPLHVAAQQRHKEVMKILLENGADSNAKNRYGSSVLHYATNCLYSISRIVIRGRCCQCQPTRS
jgi:hypothetical protein